MHKENETVSAFKELKDKFDNEFASYYSEVTKINVIKCALDELLDLLDESVKCSK